MPSANPPNPGATSKSGGSNGSRGDVIRVSNGATVQYIRNNTAIEITNTDGAIERYRILPKPKDPTKCRLEEELRCKGQKAVWSHSDYLDFQSKVRNDTTTALKGNTNIKLKDCPLKARLDVCNALKDEYPYFFRFENDWAAQELMRRVLENKRDHKKNKTVEKRAEVAKRKANGKQPATGNKKGKQAPEDATGASNAEANGAGPSNSEHTATPGSSCEQPEPNADEDDVNSDREIERRGEPSRRTARPKMVRRVESADSEANRAPGIDTPTSPVTSTVGRTSSPGPSQDTTDVNTGDKPSKKRKSPDVEEAIDSEGDTPVKTAKKSKAAEGKRKETDIATPVGVPVLPTPVVKNNKKKDQKAPAPELSDPIDSESEEELPLTKKAKTNKKGKVTLIPESDVDEDTPDAIVPPPTANVTENNKKKGAANNGEKIAPVATGAKATKKRKAPEPEPEPEPEADSSDLSEGEDEGKNEGKSKDKAESGPEAERAVAPKPKGKHPKRTTGGEGAGSARQPAKLVQQDSWEADYSAQVTELAKEMTPAQKRAATMAAKAAQAAADKAVRDAQAAADKAAQVAKAAAELDTPQPKRRKNASAKAPAPTKTLVAKTELVESVVKQTRTRTKAGRA